MCTGAESATLTPIFKVPGMQWNSQVLAKAVAAFSISWVPTRSKFSLGIRKVPRVIRGVPQLFLQPHRLKSSRYLPFRCSREISTMTLTVRMSSTLRSTPGTSASSHGRGMAGSPCGQSCWAARRRTEEEDPC